MKSRRPVNTWKRQLILSITAVGLLTGGSLAVIWSKAQSLPPSDRSTVGSGVSIDQELARLAISNPVDFSAEMQKHRTEDDIRAERIAILSITQPAVYSAQLEPFKDAHRRMLEQQARASVLAPASGLDKAKLEKERRKAGDMLRPAFMSGNSP